MGLEQEQYGQGGHLGEAGGHRYEPYLGHGEEAGLVVGAKDKVINEELRVVRVGGGHEQGCGVGADKRRQEDSCV